jgi:DNA-binding LacI/PurR family transcriptional regulator
LTTGSDRKAGNPTIKDVAERAGFSVGTVSRAINSGGRISARAIERVEAAIRELNHSPNISARRLRTGRSVITGFCTRDITNPLFSPLARAFQHVLEDRGLTLLISNTFDDPKRERDMVRRDINAIGRTAAQAVVNLIEGVEMPLHAIFRILTELVVRNSCGSPGSLPAHHN